MTKIQNCRDSIFSLEMAKTEWDFWGCKTAHDRREMAKCLKVFLEAMDKLGWVEHTADWDPYLVIKLKTQYLSGVKEIFTPHGYYLIETVFDGKLYIQAPCSEDLTEDDTAMNIHICYQDSSDGARPMYGIYLDDIDTIKISR